ncbi:MAG TPA: helix-turn-helix transcriptional regulator [Candidatus Pullichristensenella excrementipullorum]|nr:helix-turn-helix transcriptional regulator [Candidatus Pullichristensenella excrementipullorum]
MTFGEKVRAAREAKNMSQEQLAAAIGMSKRMVVYWENDGKLPKSRDVYPRIANVLGIDVSVLLDDNAEFVIKAAETYGNRGAKQALRLVQEITGLYAGGELEEDDMDAMMKAIQDAYWIAKQKNKRHTNKRYLVKDEPQSE